MRRFVKATLAGGRARPRRTRTRRSSRSSTGRGTSPTRRQQAREVLDVTLSILLSPNNKEKQLGLNVPADWDSALDMLKKYKDLKTDQPASGFYTNDFVPAKLD